MRISQDTITKGYSLVSRLKTLIYETVPLVFLCVKKTGMVTVNIELVLLLECYSHTIILL